MLDPPRCKQLCAQIHPSSKQKREVSAMHPGARSGQSEWDDGGAHGMAGGAGTIQAIELTRLMLAQERFCTFLERLPDQSLKHLEICVLGQLPPLLG